MSKEPANTRPARCPVCRKAADEAYRPFCSKRCADIDLGKWFTGGYSIAGRVEDEGNGGATSEDVKPADEDA
jgi:endogenous inhibitor of DNA gyrase (YacG/DUF329 family)